MKRPETDTQLPPADPAKVKDKRTLVLFLLGLMLLSLDFWPKGAVVSHGYGIVVDDATLQFQLFSTSSGTDTLQAGAGKTALGLPRDHCRRLVLAPGQDLAPEIPAALSLFLNRPLPINRADKAALEMLPGVGPHLAEAILAARQKRGRFNGPDDLLEVSGIGPKKLQHFLPLLSLE